MMNSKRFFRSLLLALVVSLVAVSCQPEEITGTVSESALFGTWYATDNPQEYWRFDFDHTGETWDESEDVQEGEGSKFDWSTKDDQLRLDIHGQMGQHVYYDYTITKQSSSAFTWEDLYGNSRTFYKR